jgi:hypothetical protein
MVVASTRCRRVPVPNGASSPSGPGLDVDIRGDEVEAAHACRFHPRRGISAPHAGVMLPLPRDEHSPRSEGSLKDQFEEWPAV